MSPEPRRSPLLDSYRNLELRPRARIGRRGSGELGEDHHNQQFYLAG